MSRTIDDGGRLREPQVCEPISWLAGDTAKSTTPGREAPRADGIRGWIRSRTGNLKALSASVDNLKAVAKAAANDKSGPSASIVKKNLAITSKTTIGELENAAGMGLKNIAKEYETGKKSSEDNKRKFREAGDFKAELKIIKGWIAEADQMEEEEETL